MTEVTTYKCDYCGKEFEFEDDCIKHELEHQTTLLDKRVILLTHQEEEIPLNEPWHFNSCYYMYILDKEAYDALCEMFDKEGYISPRDFGLTPYFPAAFFYNHLTDEWDDIDEQAKEIRRLITIRGEMQDSLYSHIYEKDEIK